MWVGMPTHTRKGLSAPEKKRAQRSQAGGPRFSSGVPGSRAYLLTRLELLEGWAALPFPLWDRLPLALSLAEASAHSGLSCLDNRPTDPSL